MNAKNKIPMATLSVRVPVAVVTLIEILSINSGLSKSRIAQILLIRQLSPAPDKILPDQT
jgi:hypothetical protein